MSSTEKSKMNKQISIHHLYYVILIAGLILLFVILLFPYGVSRYAFDNFSFASTITSIVLAVVSIVYSIQSPLLSALRKASRSAAVFTAGLHLMRAPFTA